VVCMDTLGQDRELTEQQKRFVLETVRSFQLAWESSEVRALTNDRDRKIEQMKVDPTAEQEQ